MWPFPTIIIITQEMLLFKFQGFYYIQGYDVTFTFTRRHPPTLTLAIEVKRPVWRDCSARFLLHTCDVPLSMSCVSMSVAAGQVQRATRDLGPLALRTAQDLKGNQHAA